MLSSKQLRTGLCSDIGCVWLAGADYQNVEGVTGVLKLGRDYLDYWSWEVADTGWVVNRQHVEEIVYRCMGLLSAYDSVCYLSSLCCVPSNPIMRVIFHRPILTYKVNAFHCILAREWDTKMVL